MRQNDERAPGRAVILVGRPTTVVRSPCLITRARRKTSAVPPPKIDPTQLILMWLCAEKRLATTTITQQDVADRARERGAQGTRDKASVSAWERGRTWGNDARVVIQVYADLAGVGPADLWDEAVRLTPRRDGHVLDSAPGLDEIPQRLSALRKLAQQASSRAH